MSSTTNSHSIFTNTNENIKLNTDTVYKPLRSYLLYVLIRTFKSVSTIVILSMTMIAALILSLLPSFFAENQKAMVIIITPMMLITVLVTLTATFGVAKSLDLFVGFQSEGTELIIVSKPISRTQILIVKFLFLLILGLVYCAIIVGVCAIGFAVVGFDEYANSGISLGGIFLAIVLSYMIMGLLSIAISIISDTSDKIAKTMPTLILSISVSCSLMVPQLITATNQNPKSEQVERFRTTLMNSTIGSGLTYGEEPGKPGYPVRSVTFLTPLPFTYDKTNSTIVLSTLTAAYQGDSGLKTINISNGDFRINKIGDEVPYKPEREKIYKFAMDIALAEFQAHKLETTGMGWTAFNYLNPISAFLSISGISISMSVNSNGLPYNYAFDGFTSEENVISGNGRYQYPSAIKVAKVNQGDPQWALALVWAIIWVALGAFTVIGYQRKDFK